MNSSEQLRELGFMETQRALPPVPGLQGTMGELVVTNFGEREQSQEVVAHQDNSAVEIVLSKGLSRKVRPVNDLSADSSSNVKRLAFVHISKAQNQIDLNSSTRPTSPLEGMTISDFQKRIHSEISESVDGLGIFIVVDDHISNATSYLHHLFQSIIILAASVIK
ncbi:hypothetical protein V6N13_074279 [Hibiscus sabdariffa]